MRLGGGRKGGRRHAKRVRSQKNRAISSYFNELRILLSLVLWVATVIRMRTLVSDRGHYPSQLFGCK